MDVEVHVHLRENFFTRHASFVCVSVCVCSKLQVSMSTSHGPISRSRCHVTQPLQNQHDCGQGCVTCDKPTTRSQG